MTYTLDELRTNEAKLRRAAGEVLDPGPWKHREGLYAPDGACLKCELSGVFHNDGPCPIPDPAEGPLEVVAEQLVKQFVTPSLEGLKLWRAIAQFYRLKFGEIAVAPPDDLIWFILWATPAEQMVCCLPAEGKVRVPDPKRGRQDCHVGPFGSGPGDNIYVYG
ncbi:MAG: hypothetical protein V2B18_25405 [Pseudomonadota bacterium]